MIGDFFDGCCVVTSRLACARSKNIFRLTNIVRITNLLQPMNIVRAKLRPPK